MMNPKMTLLRLLVRARRVAKSCAVTATACAATAWWCSYSVVFTTFGLVYTVAAMVTWSVVAGFCWLVSGEG